MISAIIWGRSNSDGLNKPYFRLAQDGRLLLQNVPVPPQHSRTAVPVPLLDKAHNVLMERTFLYSLFESVRSLLIRKVSRLIG